MNNTPRSEQSSGSEERMEAVTRKLAAANADLIRKRIQCPESSAGMVLEGTGLPPPATHSRGMAYTTRRPPSVVSTGSSVQRGEELGREHYEARAS